MFNVLVFPSCNEPGLEVVNSLIKNNKISVHGASSVAPNVDPSKQILKHHHSIPIFGDPRFEKTLRQIIDEHNINLVFPTVDALVHEFSGWAIDGCAFVTPNRETMAVLASKRTTYEALQDAIPVSELCGENQPLPVFAKPEVGSGSREAFVVDSAEKLAVARSLGLMLNEYLPGAEYTVDCISGLDGRLLFANARRRSVVGRGIALGTIVEKRADLQVYVARATEILKLRGPWFAQFKEAVDGTPKLLEINARVPGSMSLTRAIGVNIPLLSTFMFLGYEVRVPSPKTVCIRMNRVLRNLVDWVDYEYVIWDLDETLVRKDGKPDPDVIWHLYDCWNRAKKNILLTKNKDMNGTLRRCRIPDVFIDSLQCVDKLKGLTSIIKRYRLDVGDFVLVNDSYSENLLFQSTISGIHILTPAEISTLGNERLS